MKQITVPLTDLLRTPNGPRNRQLLLGDRVEIIATEDGYHRIKDETGYEGFITVGTTGEVSQATHVVAARSTHCYNAADFKSADSHALGFTAKVTTLSETGNFLETALGYVPKQHLRPFNQPQNDLVDAAMTLLGTPYLWGGNSGTGIDCSGLIEAAQRATGQTVTARDSGDQEKTLGLHLPLNSPYQRNDLLFWKGHVALVLDAKTMIHANAHHMAVVLENIETAKERIKRQGDGEITAHKRL